MNTTIPNLYIIGVVKGGTTSLHDILSQHPDIQMSTIKEPHYFSEKVKEIVPDYSGSHSTLIKT